MRDYEPERGAHIKHYKIKCLDQGGYYVTTRQTFTTLPELVSAYMRTKSFFSYLVITSGFFKKRKIEPFFHWNSEGKFHSNEVEQMNCYLSLENVLEFLDGFSTFSIFLSLIIF